MLLLSTIFVKMLPNISSIYVSFMVISLHSKHIHTKTTKKCPLLYHLPVYVPTVEVHWFEHWSFTTWCQFCIFYSLPSGCQQVLQLIQKQFFLWHIVLTVIFFCWILNHIGGFKIYFGKMLWTVYFVLYRKKKHKNIPVFVNCFWFSICWHIFYNKNNNKTWK